MSIKSVFSAKMRSPKQINANYLSSLLATIPIARVSIAILTTIAFFMIGYDWLYMMKDDLHPSVYIVSGLLVASVAYLITDQVWVASAEMFYYNTFNLIDGNISTNFFWYLNYLWYTMLCAGGFAADVYAIKILSENVELHAPSIKAPDITKSQKEVYDLSKDVIGSINKQIKECEKEIASSHQIARQQKPSWARAESQGHQWAKIELSRRAANIANNARERKAKLIDKLNNKNDETAASANEISKFLQDQYNSEVIKVKKRTTLASSAALYMGLFCKIALFLLIGATWSNFFANTPKGARDINKDGHIDMEDMRKFAYSDMVK